MFDGSILKDDTVVRFKRYSFPSAKFKEFLNALPVCRMKPAKEESCAGSIFIRVDPIYSIDFGRGYDGPR
jgi:hypothetical protein